MGARPVNVFLFAGQSNMEGRADGGRISAVDRARLEAVQDRITFVFNDEAPRPLDVYVPSGEIREIYKRDTMFGPELFFGIALAEAWPEERFLFVKLAAGGTSLHGAWNPDWSEEKATLMGEAEDPRLYGEFRDLVRATLRESDAYTIRAMCWVQGETDSSVKNFGPVPANTYGDTLSTLIVRNRADVQLPDMPFLFVRVGRGAVARGMDRIAAETPNVTMIAPSKDEQSPDFFARMENGHFNHIGVKQMGVRLAEEYLQRYAPAR
jgi:hypothetical protein